DAYYRMIGCAAFKRTPGNDDRRPVGAKDFPRNSLGGGVGIDEGGAVKTARLQSLGASIGLDLFHRKRLEFGDHETSQRKRYWQAGGWLITRAGIQGIGPFGSKRAQVDSGSIGRKKDRRRIESCLRGRRSRLRVQRGKAEPRGAQLVISDLPKSRIQQR